MDNKPLHIKYRPKNFDEVIGNKQTVKCLQAMLKKSGHPQVFMFHGKSGTGKTTLARIIAKEVGCNKHSLVEINAADDRGIETGRNILQMVKTSPLFGKARVIILDEAHQMSKDMQGSLLKVLEEPPENTYFIFCTTDPQKVIETIRGQRCTQFEIKPCIKEEIIGLLKDVIKKENALLDKEVIEHIAELSEGIPRRALVFLGKIIHLEDKSLKAIEKILILEEENKQAIDLCRALISGKDWSSIKGILKSIVENKPDYEQIRQMVLGYVSSVALNSGFANKKAMLIYECFKDPFYTAGKAHLIFACLFCLK